MSAPHTIDGLRSLLSGLDAQAAVFIDNQPPTALSSYRGYYDHLAIERTATRQNAETAADTPGEPFDIDLPGWGRYHPGIAEVAIKTPPTVDELIKALDLAVGSAFEGYKGGQFTMRPDTQLWVSEYGRCDRLRIAGIESLDDRVDLVTKEVDW